MEKFNYRTLELKYLSAISTKDCDTLSKYCFFFMNLRAKYSNEKIPTQSV